MAENLWQKLRVKLGRSKKLTRSFAPATTPEEVTTANGLRQAVPTSLATYLYVRGAYDVGMSRSVAGFVMLQAQAPAQQGGMSQKGFSSAYEAELALMVDLLRQVDITKRQSQPFVLVTPAADLVRDINDFSLTVRLGNELTDETSTATLKRALLSELATFRDIRVVASSAKDAQIDEFLTKKLARILGVYREAGQS